MFIDPKTIVFESGIDLDSIIKGYAKLIDQAKISPISVISANFNSDFTENHAMTVSDVQRYATISDEFELHADTGILKNKNAYYTTKDVEFDIVYEFNTVNNTGEAQSIYMVLMPRYYLNDDYNSPVNWSSHVHHMSFEIPTGTRRWTFPVHDVFHFGQNTSGIDFMLYPAQVIEGLTYTTTRIARGTLKGYSTQYQ